MTAQLKKMEDGKGEALHWDDNLGDLRELSIQWLWNAHKVLGDQPALIKKVNHLPAMYGAQLISISFQAFQKCEVWGWNLSFEFLTCFEAREKLRKLRLEDPEFWKELTEERTPELPAIDIKIPEDVESFDDKELGPDDSDLPVQTIIKSMLKGSLPVGTAVQPDGGLMSIADAEDLDSDLKDTSGGHAVNPECEREDGNIQSRPKRTQKLNKLYNSVDFWRHDLEESNLDWEHGYR